MFGFLAINALNAVLLFFLIFFLSSILYTYFFPMHSIYCTQVFKHYFFLTRLSEGNFYVPS